MKKTAIASVKKTIIAIALGTLLIITSACKMPSMADMQEAVTACHADPDPYACLGARAVGWAGVDSALAQKIVNILLILYRDSLTAEGVTATDVEPFIVTAVSGDPIGCAPLSDRARAALISFVTRQGWAIYVNFGPDEAAIALRGLYRCYGFDDGGGERVLVDGGIPLSGLLEHRKPFYWRVAPTPTDTEAIPAASDCLLEFNPDWATRGWAEPLRCRALATASATVGENLDRVLSDAKSRGTVETWLDGAFARQTGLDRCSPDAAQASLVVSIYLASCRSRFVECGGKDEIGSVAVATAARYDANP